MRMSQQQYCRRWLARALSLAVLPTFLMVTPAIASDDYDKVRLRYATFLPATHVREILTQKWMDEVTKRSGGQVTFDAYRDQALLQTTALLDGASRGIADISYVATGYHPSELPLTTMIDLPFLTNNSQAQMAAITQLDAEFEGLRKEYDKLNLVLLASLSGDPTILGSREPWKTIADIKGKRIRAFGAINQTLQALGAVPVALPAPDIYTSMERKVIEGYSGLPASLIPPWALHEVSNYVIDYGAGLYANVGIFMNKRKFTSLNPRTRALLTDTFADLIKDVYIADLVKVNRERAKAIQDAKMTFIRWSKEEREAARKIIADTVWEDAIRSREAKGVPARAFVTRMRELITEHEKTAKDYIDPVTVALGPPD
jgi:TRAP-type transport system periplasmic protein